MLVPNSQWETNVFTLTTFKPTLAKKFCFSLRFYERKRLGNVCLAKFNRNLYNLGLFSEELKLEFSPSRLLHSNIFMSMKICAKIHSFLQWLKKTKNLEMVHVRLSEYRYRI